VERPLRIHFTDVGWHRHGDLYVRWTHPHFDAIGMAWKQVVDDPDVVFVGFGGEDYRRFDCVRVRMAGENVRPNFDEFDFVMGVDILDDPRYLRVPFGNRTYRRLHVLAGKPAAEKIARGRTGFCNFVYSNPHPPERIRLFRLLSRYRKVDSFGPVLNNMPFEPHAGERYAPDWPEVKRRVQARYKFTIAFESESWPGYTTEKICDAMETGTIPIYWGNPRIAEDFNPRSFINCHAFDSLEEVVERIIEIDQDDALYMNMLAEPWFENDRVPDRFRPEMVTAFLRKIFLSVGDMLPVARQPEARARASGALSPGKLLHDRYTPRQRWFCRHRYVTWPAFINRLRRVARRAGEGDWRWFRKRLTRGPGGDG
jgi:hypothetical protein